jgi:hypothetical protein
MWRERLEPRGVPAAPEGSAVVTPGLLVARAASRRTDNRRAKADDNRRASSLHTCRLVNCGSSHLGDHRGVGDCRTCAHLQAVNGRQPIQMLIIRSVFRTVQPHEGTALVYLHRAEESR